MPYFPYAINYRYIFSISLLYIPFHKLTYSNDLILVAVVLSLLILPTGITYFGQCYGTDQCGRQQQYGCELTMNRP